MLERLRTYMRRRREERAARKLEEAQYLAEARQIRDEHETQKWQGEVGQPKTPKSDW
jgi:hypothetical protein